MSLNPELTNYELLRNELAAIKNTRARIFQFYSLTNDSTQLLKVFETTELLQSAYLALLTLELDEEL